MSNHTPGPWNTNGEGNTGYRIKTATKEGFSLIPNIEMTRDEMQANARLIAAAPDILQALTAILALSHLIPQPATHDGLQLADALAAARAAVERAA